MARCTQGHSHIFTYPCLGYCCALGLHHCNDCWIDHKSRLSLWLIGHIICIWILQTPLMGHRHMSHYQIVWYENYTADNSSFLNVCTWPMTWPMTHAEEESMWLSSTCCVPTHPLPRQGVQGGEVSRTVWCIVKVSWNTAISELHMILRQRSTLLGPLVSGYISINIHLHLANTVEPQKHCMMSFSNFRGYNILTSKR